MFHLHLLSTYDNLISHVRLFYVLDSNLPHQFNRFKLLFQGCENLNVFSHWVYWHESFIHQDIQIHFRLRKDVGLEIIEF